jgi:hypothetical protein
MDKYFATLKELQKEAWRVGSHRHTKAVEMWAKGSELRNASIDMWKEGGELRNAKINMWKEGGEMHNAKMQRAQVKRGGATRRQRGGSALGNAAKVGAQTVVTPNGNVFYQTTHHDSARKKERVPCIGDCGEDFARGNYKRYCAVHLRNRVGFPCFEALKELDEEALRDAINTACPDAAFRPTLKTANMTIESAKIELEKNGGKTFGQIKKPQDFQTKRRVAECESRKRKRAAKFFNS